MTRQISEAFYAISQLALMRGHKKIKDLDGCLEMDIDDNWSVSLNGHKTLTLDSMGTSVPPRTVIAYRNSMPVASIGTTGGEVVGGAEDELIAAIYKALS